MPFGKFKGSPVNELPVDYLRWMWNKIELRPPLVYAVADALKGAVESTRSGEKDGKIKKAYRQMALKYHPDRGGSEEGMKVINEFYEKLIE